MCEERQAGSAQWAARLALGCAVHTFLLPPVIVLLRHSSSALHCIFPNPLCTQPNIYTLPLHHPQVYGISTEDMDSLTFGTPRLIRHLMTPASLKANAMEFDHELVSCGLAGGQGGAHACAHVAAMR